MSTKLFAGVSLAAILAVSGTAIAQEVDSDASATEANEDARTLETVIVSGFRQANSAAIADKRSANGITDGINQDTIGLLPDLTVADIARRIPGVTSVSSTGVAGPRSQSAS